MHGIYDHIPESFEPCHHSGLRSMLVELENQVRLSAHYLLVEMLQKGIHAAAEVRQVNAETVRTIFYETGRLQNPDADSPVYFRKIGDSHGIYINEIHRKRCDTDP